MSEGGKGKREPGRRSAEGHERAWSSEQEQADLFEAEKGSQHGQWVVTEGKMRVEAWGMGKAGLC